MGKTRTRRTSPDNGLRRTADDGESQATYVASGKFELNIGGETRILEAGDGYYVAPDELHGCVCLEAGVLIDTFSPVRADFLGI